MIYTKNGTVNGNSIDADARLSVLGAAQLAQEAVTEMMGRLGIDNITERERYNAAWVFVKNKIILAKPIIWGEEFTISSFMSHIGLATLKADTVIKNTSGEIVAYSVIEMCALDLDTGKILKTTAVGVNESVVKEQSEMNVVFGKPDDCDFQPTEEVAVRSTSIDYSRHTNNVEYIRFILNTYSVVELSDKPIKELEIYYINQSYENDVLKIGKFSCGDTDCFSIEKADKPIVRCRILR